MIDQPGRFVDGPRRSLRFALSVGGYVVTGAILTWGFGSGKFSLPGNDALIWDRVGDQLRSGVSPYLWPDPTTGFYYAPPWAVLFAAVSWLPVQVVALGIIAAEVAALRYIAGSWERVGYFCWFPLLAFELPSSQINLIVAAGIAAALRGDPRLAVVVGSAKLSPLLSIDRRAIHRTLPVVGLLVVVTLPWASLWVEWIAELVSSYGVNTAPSATIAIPFAARLVGALVLVLVGQPWARGLAAIVALPALYWVSSVMLVSLLPLRRDHESTDAR